MTADEFRLHRSNGAVLKTRLSQIRTRKPESLIFVFEGDFDVGPYSVLITRIKAGYVFEPLAGAGKSQVLDLRRRLQVDKTGLARSVYLFVDNDFDGLRGQLPGPDLYCSDGYSIENTCVSDEVLASILTDEFRCTAEYPDRERAMEFFGASCTKFFAAIKRANKRLFRARKLGIQAEIRSDKVGDYVKVELDNVSDICDEASLAQLIRLDREPTEMECVAIDAAFDTLCPLVHYRGKFVLSFFTKWIGLLIEARRKGDERLFTSPKAIRVGAEALSMRSLASRCQIPDSLKEFLPAQS